jgi:D-alanine-D-alanine ligase
MKKKIALVTGGTSGEAVISYKTAKTISTHLSRELYDVYLIDITTTGWFYTDEAGNKQSVDKNDFSITVNGSKLNFDCAFIALHGTPGEDGKLQGYFERYTVAVAAFAGIKVANSVHLFKHIPVDANTIHLKFPVFVKPNNGGSSIGMSKVNRKEDLAAAIEKAFKEDDQVLVEEMIEGREFTIGVFKSKGEIIALPMTEVKAHDDKDFFDFEAKYQGKSDEVTPAVASETHYKNVADAAKKIYSVFNCRGVIRIDFIYNEAEQAPYMLEINSIPGQSDASIVPQQAQVYGWTLEKFYGALAEDAINNH